MRHSSSPGNGARPRGAIRTHLGRKRVGARGRPLREQTIIRMRQAPETDRGRQEDLFDRLFGKVQELFEDAGEATAEAFDRAVDTACETLVKSGEFTRENGERLRQFVRRDLLHRADPGVSFRTGEITTPGTLTCVGCGWMVRFTRTTTIPPCPKCVGSVYRKEM